MILTIATAAAHYLTLAIGFTALTLRGQALKALIPETQIVPEKLSKVFLYDNLYGIAALFWIITGLLRAFGGLEKGTAYYMQSQFFWIKMLLFLGVFLLEIKPMMTFIKWRLQIRKNEPLSSADFKGLARRNTAELHLLVLIVIAASTMARGF